MQHIRKNGKGLEILQILGLTKYLKIKIDMEMI